MIISVESTVGDDSAIESSNSFSALASALIEVQSWNARIDDVEQDFIDRANNLDATYPTRLVSVEQQLAETATKAELSAIATPKAVSLVSQMTDIAKIYVYTGVEGGYTAGNWYYHNGSTWASGGVYQSTGITDNSISATKLSFVTVVGLKSKNLFNKLAITPDNYVNKNTGVLVSAVGYFTSEYIAVLPSTAYTIKALQFIAYYDANKAFISGVSGTLTNYTLTTPANAYYVRFSDNVAVLETEQMELGSASTVYESFPAKVPSSSFVEKYTKGAKGKNLIDKSSVTTGYYVKHSNGVLTVNADLSATGYIDVSAYVNQKITLSNANQSAFFDASYAFISGNTNANLPSTITVPSNAKYIRVSIVNTSLNIAQMEVGQFSTDYEPYMIDDIRHAYDYVDSKINKTVTVRVKQNGTGNFIKFSDAVAAITDASKSKQYVIEVYEGTYDIMAELFVTPPDGTNEGIILPDYVHIKGIGKKENIILKGELPDGSNTNAVDVISTINMKHTNTLENITVTAKNLRYAIHSESSGVFKFWTQIAKNCTFIHYGNQVGYWDSTAAWGEGCSDGSRSEFYDCEFISVQECPTYLVHNNINFTTPCYHLFKNCSFSTPLSALGSFLIQSYGSGTKDIIECVGCKWDNFIFVSRTGAYVGAHNFKVIGYGNSVVPQKIDTILSNENETFVDFAEETIRGKNATVSTILKGVACKNDGLGKIKPMTTGDSATLFVGFAQHDIAADAVGVIKTSGYVELSVIGVTANLGDKIGMVDGVPSVVTTGDYIGVVKMVGYVLLK